MLVCVKLSSAVYAVGIDAIVLRCFWSQASAFRGLSNLNLAINKITGVAGNSQAYEYLRR